VIITVSLQTILEVFPTMQGGGRESKSYGSGKERETDRRISSPVPSAWNAWELRKRKCHQYLSSPSAYTPKRFPLKKLIIPPHVYTHASQHKL